MGIQRFLTQKKLAFVTAINSSVHLTVLFPKSKSGKTHEQRKVIAKKMDGFHASAQFGWSWKTLSEKYDSFTISDLLNAFFTINLTKSVMGKKFVDDLLGKLTAFLAFVESLVPIKVDMDVLKELKDGNLSAKIDLTKVVHKLLDDIKSLSPVVGIADLTSTPVKDIAKAFLPTVQHPKTDREMFHAGGAAVDAVVSYILRDFQGVESVKGYLGLEEVDTVDGKKERLGPCVFIELDLLNILDFKQFAGFASMAVRTALDVWSQQ